MDDGEYRLPTISGLVSTFIVTIIIFIYLGQKFDDLINKGGIKVLTTVKEDFFTDDYKLSLADQGINFAVGFSAYDGSTEPVLFPEYGDLVVVRSRWGDDENGVFWVRMKFQPTRVQERS